MVSKYAPHLTCPGIRESYFDTHHDLDPNFVTSGIVVKDFFYYRQANCFVVTVVSIYSF